MRDTSKDEAGAAAYARVAGISEDFGGGPGDQTANVLLQQSLGPCPWCEWICQACGAVTEQQPEVCTCGLRNYGRPA